MRNKIFLGLFLILLGGIINIHAQGRNFIFTTSATNINGSRAMIDHPALNDNPDAIIIAAQLGSASHPTGVWYLGGKWYVVNRDQETMATGLNFQIMFRTKPDATHFVHIVDVAKNLKNGVSYIDHPALNNYPNASFYHTQSTAGFGNPASTLPKYDYTLKQWYLTTIEGKPMLNLNRYNIAVIDSGARDGREAIQKPEELGNVKQNVANDLASRAGGDLSGNYPNPIVIGLQNRPLSSLQPQIGDTLKWDGTQWKPTATPQTPISQPLTTTTPGNMPVSTSSQTPQESAVKTQTFFKYGTGGAGTSTGDLDGNDSKIVPLLTHNITLDKKSRVLINATVQATKFLCFPSCNAGKGYLTVRINDNPGLTPTWAGVATIEVDGSQDFSINNLMIELNPGTYKIDFIAVHTTSSKFNVAGRHSSIMVIPLE